MSDNTPDDLPKSREGILEEIWEKMAVAVARALSTDAPSAATITAGRQFLADNGITLDTLPQLKRKAVRGGLGDIGPLPVFTPEPGDEATTDTPVAPQAVDEPSSRRAGSIAWHNGDGKAPTGKP